jgi:hypothetical protein
MATPVRRSGAPERVPAAALVRTPLAILLANESIEDVLKVATQARDRYPHWAQLFAAMRMRSEAGRGTPEEVRVRVGSEDIVARLALAQLERTHVFDRIASGQEVNAEEFAAASEVRRWYARVARGHSTSTRVSAEHARREYWRIVEAQEARLRSVYNIPSALPIEPRMRETLVELYTAHLTRLTDPTNNNVNRGMLELILGRIRRAFFGDYDDEMLTDAARVEWNRVHKVTGRGKKLSPDDLPDLARKQYEQLAKVAGRFGFPAYWS